MPLDDRLREALRDNANTFDPDPETAWAHINRSRRRTLVRRTVGLVASAAVLLIGLAITIRPTDEPPAPATPITTPDTIPRLTGHYRATLEPSADADRYQLTGTWEVTFDPTGTVDVRAPSGFSGVLSAQLYQLDGDQFRTDLFHTDLCSGLEPATYRWQIDDRGILRFTTIDDDCPPRTTVWTTADWQPTP